MANNWFSYNGFGDPTLPGSYFRAVIKPTCITGGCMICAIYLDDNSTAAPSTITAVLSYIANAHLTLTSQPADGFKRFVYVKDCC